MRELYLKSKETVSAASLVDDQIEYLERFESEIPLRVLR
jgi:DNA-binding IclR family transcriptional regulator